MSETVEQLINSDKDDMEIVSILLEQAQDARRELLQPAVILLAAVMQARMAQLQIEAMDRHTAAVVAHTTALIDSPVEGIHDEADEM